MKRTVIYLLLTLLVVGSTNFAQSKKHLNERAIKNLIAGIKSENVGLKRSSIYFAGYYRIEDAAIVTELRNLMFSDEEPGIKILAALSLYEIRNEDVLNDLNLLAQTPGENVKVRKMAKAIYDYWVTSAANYANFSR